MNLSFIIIIGVLTKVYLCQTLREKLEKHFARDDLICPDTCRYTSENKYFDDEIECCVCLCKPLWMFNNSILVTLNLELTDFETPVVSSDSSQTADYYSITYQHGNISVIPVNICNYSDIVYVDFSNNNITDINGISCTEKLDTLILKENNIQHVNFTIFHPMKYLRIIDLSLNKLTYVEPGFTFNMVGSLFFLDLSFNNLTVVDVTNVLWNKQKYFCTVNFSHNSIESISNTQKWQENSAVTDFGAGGYIDFTNNKFRYFLDFPHLGFADVTMLGLLYRYSFDFRFNEWICDCRFYPLVSKSDLAAGILGSDHTHLRCTAPPEFKNKPVRTFLQELDLLICNISLGQKCPPRCHCFYQPNLNRTVVNCRRSTLVSHKLPLVLPDNYNLDVDFSENSISEKEIDLLLLQPDITYSTRIKEINLSNNKIANFPDFVVQVLKHAQFINMTGNLLSKIPHSLKNIHPCNIALGKIFIKCKCGDIWLKTWIPSDTSPCYSYTQVFCHTDTGIKSITDTERSEFGCDEESYLKWINISLGVIIGVVALISFIFYNFYIELCIVWTETMKKHKMSGMYQSCSYDIYISINEEDETLRYWVFTSLISYLKRNGYRVFIPCRDCTVGKPREEDIIDVMSKTRSVLLILSENYPDHMQQWISHEWKYAWINYKAEFRKNLIIINYDMLNWSDISNKYIKAFLRLGKYVDFSNNRKTFEQTVASMLGRPTAKYKQESKNRKLRFRSVNFKRRIYILNEHKC